MTALTNWFQGIDLNRIIEWLMFAAAERFGVSKSTVHKDLTERLERADRLLWLRVRVVLDRNKAERHLRGGEATRRRYERIRD